MFCESRKKEFERFFNNIRTELNIPEDLSVMISGEFVGAGIQKGVGVSLLERSFVIFSIKIIDFSDESKNYYISEKENILKVIKAPDKRIYNIYDFPTYEIDIDFNYPELYQNKLIELTTLVADECPVSKLLLKDRIEKGENLNLLGEGIVFRSEFKNQSLIFKSKDERHSKSSKIKILRPIDEYKINKKIDVANKVTPEWRLEQMFEKTFNFMNNGTFNRSKLGDFIRNVFTDILKEDIDILIQEEIELKEINKYVSDISRQFFFQKEKELLNI